MSLLSDYTARDTETGDVFAEGELSAAEKQAALEADLELIVVKNSWNAGADELGERFITDGYNRFVWDDLVYNTDLDGEVVPMLNYIVLPRTYLEEDSEEG